MVSTLDIKAREDVRLRELIDWNSMLFVGLGILLVISAYLMKIGGGDMIVDVHWTVFAAFYAVLTLIALGISLRHVISYATA